jgi:putative membrane protein insertion efficiency factor
MRPIPVSSVSSTPSSSEPPGHPSLAVELPAPGLAARAALGLIRAYKLVLSPWFTGACRFMPTCADYTAEAIARHGLVRGSWLGARRLGRCHPFGSHGHDPVPTSLARPSGNETNPTRPVRLTGPNSFRTH